MRAFCLSISNVSTPGAVMDHLIRAAHKMGNEGVDTLTLRGDGFEARIVNTRRYAILCYIGGTIFEAEVESDLNKGKIRILVDFDVPLAHDMPIYTREAGQDPMWN